MESVSAVADVCSSGEERCACLKGERRQKGGEREGQAEACKL